MENHTTILPVPAQRNEFLCDACGKTLTTFGELKLHELFIHKKHCCSVCNERFGLETDLLKHQTQSHANVAPLLCQYCAFTAKTPHSLRRHEECRHEQTSVEQLVCDCCGLAFTHAGELRRHVQKKHPENYAGKLPQSASKGKYQCDLCSYSASKKIWLTKHINKEHAAGDKQ